MKGNQSKVSRPDREVERRTTGSGPVTTYKLTPEELERLNNKGKMETIQQKGKETQKHTKQRDDIAREADQQALDGWVEAERLQSELQDKEKEIKRLNEALAGAAVIAEQSGEIIRELEGERQLLLETIENASVNTIDPDFITIRVPINMNSDPAKQRLGVYGKVELLATTIEAVELDRGKVTQELFDLLQGVVNYVTADLVQLLPDQDAKEYVHRFFAVHNQRRLENMKQHAG